MRYYLEGWPAVLHADAEGERWNGFRTPAPTTGQLGDYMRAVFVAPYADADATVALIADLACAYGLADSGDNMGDVLSHDNASPAGTFYGLTWEPLADDRALSHDGTPCDDVDCIHDGDHAVDRLA